MLGTRCSAIIIHQVTMRAACIISWNELMQTSFSVSKSFILILKLHSQVRPVVETGWENTLIIRTSFQGTSLWMSPLQKIRRILAEADLVEASQRFQKRKVLRGCLLLLWVF